MYYPLNLTFTYSDSAKKYNRPHGLTRIANYEAKNE